MENFREKRLERQLKSQQNISIVLGIILLLAILGIVFLFVRNNRLSDEKEELEGEKTMLTDNLQSVEESNAELQAEIRTLNEEIEKLRENAAELELEIQGREARIARLNRELVKMEDLRAEIIEYESLEEEFEKVKEEKLDLLGQLEAVNKQLSDLEEQYESLVSKVEGATYLKAYNICVHNFRDRWICRPVSMDVARRVDRTTLSFEINENLLVDPAKMDIHVVITGPDDNVVSPSTETFTIEDTGETSNFTAYTSIDYDRQPVPLDFSIEHDINLESGTYRVEVYIDGVESGTKEFMLE